MNFRYKLILFILCLIGLIVFQVKIVLPVVYDIVSSDLFLKESEDVADPQSKSTDMTGYAFEQCNLFIANDLGPEVTVSFDNQPINAWSLGDYEYVINANIDLTTDSVPTVTRRYVCRIKYKNEQDTSDVTNPENWSVNGISGLDDL